MSESGSESSTKQKQASLLRTWLTHCRNLETRTPCGAGVCAEYAIRQVLKLDKSPKDPGILQATKVLMEIVTKNLSPYKEKAPIGREDLLQLGLETFRKADGLDRSGRRDSLTRKLYYNAWEFLDVTNRLATEDPLEGDQLPEDMQDKIRYAMWRATELWKAEKENRDPCPPTMADDVLEDELNKFMDSSEELEDEWEKEEERGRMSSGSTLRDYAAGQEVLYSKDARAHNKVHASVRDVVWNEREQIQEFVIECQNGVCIRARNECLAPCVAVGEKMSLHTGEIATVDRVYDSLWPPRYLVVKEGGGFEEVQDEDMCRMPAQVDDSPYSSSYDEEELAPDDQAFVPAPNEGHKKQQEVVEDYQSTSSEDQVPIKQPPQYNHSIESKSPGKMRNAPSGTRRKEGPRYKTDIESMCKAEKLTKSALSAITFNDAETAVKFLTEALQTIDMTSKQ